MVWEENGDLLSNVKCCSRDLVLSVDEWLGCGQGGLGLPMEGEVVGGG